jgi:hypothetical protein
MYYIMGYNGMCSQQYDKGFVWYGKTSKWYTCILHIYSHQNLPTTMNGQKPDSLQFKGLRIKQIIGMNHGQASDRRTPLAPLFANQIQWVQVRKYTSWIPEKPWIPYWINWATCHGQGTPSFLEYHKPITYHWLGPNYPKWHTVISASSFPSTL